MSQIWRRISYGDEKPEDIEKEVLEMDDSPKKTEMIYELATIYGKMYKQNDMVRLHKMAIDKDYVQSMIELGKYYDRENIHLDLMIEYYSKIIEFPYLPIKDMKSIIRNCLDRLIHYYKFKSKNPEKMKYYCLKSIQFGYFKYCYDLAKYYYEVESNVEEMKKYLFIGIGNNDISVIKYFGDYYLNVEKNEDEMVYYYELAGHIEDFNDSGDAYLELGQYFEKKNDYEKMKKYYLIGINKKNSLCIFSLAKHYQYVEKNYHEMKILYEQLIQHDDFSSIYQMILYHMDIDKTYSELMKYLNKYYELYKNFNIEKMSMRMGYNVSGYYKSHENDFFKVLSYLYVYEEDDDDEKREKYLSLAIKKKNGPDTMFHIAHEFKKVNKLDECEKFFLMAIENGHKKAMYDFGNYYEEKGDSENAIKYYTMASENGYEFDLVQIKSIKE